MGQRMLQPFAKVAAIGQQRQAVMQGQMAGMTLAGLSTGQFGTRLRQGCVRIENFLLQALPAVQLITQSQLQLIQSLHALQHTDLHPALGIEQLRQGFMRSTLAPMYSALI
eukprot:Opistho-1_new@102469